MALSKDALSAFAFLEQTPAVSFGLFSDERARGAGWEGVKYGNSQQALQQQIPAFKHPKKKPYLAFNVVIKCPFVSEIG